MGASPIDGERFCIEVNYKEHGGETTVIDAELHVVAYYASH